MNEEQKEWRPPTIKEFEEKMMGVNKTEEKKADVAEPVKETKEQKLEQLKAQAKAKRQELDDIYKEIEDTI